MKVIHFETIDSTNTYCKANVHDDCIVVAREQTGGRGTKGRSFLSAKGGLYLTAVRHNVCSSAECFTIMVNSCVAVCQTLQSFGITPVIRWANDVLVNGKKICGTLIENTFNGAMVARSIVGIGLNVNNALAEEIAPIATTMSAVLGRQLNLDEVEQTLITNLQKTYTIAQYKSYMPWLDQSVSLTLPDRVVKAIAKDITPCGQLVCEVEGQQKIINVGEVSLRL